MKNLFRISAVLFFLFSLSACCSVFQKKNKEIQEDAVNVREVSSSAPVIIYKTKGDYNLHVPVMMNEDFSQIISYPDKKDVKIGGSYSTPTELHKGYLLDNRGIGANTAFLKHTYEEYFALEKTPLPSELKQDILVKDAIEVMYLCGIRANFSDIVNDLNKLIDQDELSQFKQLK